VPRLNGVKWAFHTQGEVVSSPAIVSGIVYVGSNDGKLYAIDQQTGSQKWNFSTGARLGLRQVFENLRRQNIATGDGEVRRGIFRLGFFDQVFYAQQAGSKGRLRCGLGVHDAVEMSSILRNFFNGNRPYAGGLVYID